MWADGSKWQLLLLDDTASVDACGGAIPYGGGTNSGSRISTAWGLCPGILESMLDDGRKPCTWRNVETSAWIVRGGSRANQV